MSTHTPRLARSGNLYGISLFLLTLVVELLGVWPRYLLVRLLFWPLSVLTTGIALFRTLPLVQEQQVLAPVGPGFGLQLLITLNSIGVPFAHLVAWGPLIFSLLTLVFLPGGFLLTRLALGARKPSSREKHLVQAVLAQALHADKNVRGPSAFYVIDNIEPNAYTIGTTLYIHSGLLSEMTPHIYRLGVIAHHLGHRNSLDGRLELALRRLVLYPVYLLARSLGMVAPGSFVYSVGRGDAKGCFAGTFVLFVSFFLAVAGGGVGVFLLHPLWASYWRKREFIADQFAQRLKLGGPLIEYLKRYTLNDVATPYHLNSTPSNELRIDRLLYGPDAQGTMPLPRPETGVLVGGLGVVFLMGFLWFGGVQAIGVGPRIENTQWLLVSSNSRNGTVVTTERCQLIFDATSTVEATCFAEGYGYQRLARYTYLDANTILIDPLPGGNNLPIYFSGSYDLIFSDDRLQMVSTATDYTLTWQRN
jgi:Zn-dependent protease with chaperone function